MFKLKTILPVASIIFVAGCSTVDVTPVQNKIAEAKSGPDGACIVATHDAAMDIANAQAILDGKQEVRQSTYDKAMAAADSAVANRQIVESNCHVRSDELAQVLAAHLEEYAMFRAKLQQVGDILRGVTFQEGSSTLTTEAKTVLDILSNNLMRQPKKAVVLGFTSNTGTPEINLALSQKRAESVVAYLVEKGVDPKLLLATGYGEAYPIASNDTADGRVANQRVEIKYID